MTPYFLVGDSHGVALNLFLKQDALARNGASLRSLAGELSALETEQQLIIVLGNNDDLSNADQASMWDAFLRNVAGQIAVLAWPFPANVEPHRARKRANTDIMRGIAERYGVVGHALWEGVDVEYAPDGVHFTTASYKRMAAALGAAESGVAPVPTAPPVPQAVFTPPVVAPSGAIKWLTLRAYQLPGEWIYGSWDLAMGDWDRCTVSNKAGTYSATWMFRPAEAATIGIGENVLLTGQEVTAKFGSTAVLAVRRSTDSFVIP